MDSRILKRAAVEIDSALKAPRAGGPPGFVVSGIGRPGRTELVLYLDDLGEPPERRRLILDVDPAHPTFHWSADRLETAPATTGGFAERILGYRFHRIGSPTEPRVLHLGFRERRTAHLPADEAAGKAPDARRPRRSGHGSRARTENPGPAPDVDPPVTEWLLVAEWTGRTGNLRLVSQDLEIRETLLPRGPGPGDLFSPHPPDKRLACSEADPAELALRLVGDPPGQWPRLLLRVLKDIPPEAVTDAVLRGISAASDPTGPDPEEVVRTTLGLLIEGDQAPAGEPALYAIPRSAAEEEPLFAGLPAAVVSDRRLPTLDRFRTAAAPHLMDLLAKAHQACLQREEEETRRAAMVREVRGELRRLLRLRGKVEAERGADGEGKVLRRAAEMILASLHQIRKGESFVELPDWSAGEGAPPIRVRLDPAKSPADNAEVYFKKARRWERGEPYRRRRIARIDEAAAALSVLESRLLGSETPMRPGLFEKSLSEAVGPLGRRRDRPRPVEQGSPDGSRTPGGIRPGGRLPARSSGAGGRSSPGTSTSGGRQPAAAGSGHGRNAAGSSAAGRRHEAPAWRPREFRTSDGWMVLVGRSNEENDYLTHRIAHPEDTWLHAHGVPGSHVVLRREGRKDNPSARTLQEAAAIAAWFSKARNSSKAPVIYTLKKYVRKPRKAKPGLAVCTREKTILVAPKDPTEGREPEWMDD